MPDPKGGRGEGIKFALISFIYIMCEVISSVFSGFDSL